MTASNAPVRFEDRVSVTVEGAVAHVVLDRADKLNALDGAMFDGLVAAGQYLHALAGLRCVVVSGAGRAFCAGIDLASLGEGGRWDNGALVARSHGNANLPQQAAMAWRKLPVPVIAAVHGVCFGGGLQIASGADIRVVAPDARLAVMEVKWGLVPDMAGFALWRGMVRDDVLRELIYTHREFSGEQAVALGFATHADPDPPARARHGHRCSAAGRKPCPARPAPFAQPARGGAGRDRAPRTLFHRSRA